MGDVETKVRGNVDVELGNILDACTEEQLEKVLAVCDEEGVIDGSKIKDKFALKEFMQTLE